MELRHLRYFVAVAEEEHVTRAAARLGIQQPPLSQQLRQLEQEIGVDLFDRRPRKISLNSAGKVFLSDARRLLVAVDEAVERVRSFDLGKEGTLLVGLTSSSSMHPLTISLIEEFRAAHPLISLRIEEGANHDLLTLIEEERLDFAFVRSDVTRYPALTRHTLAREAMVVAIPAKHALASEPDRPLRLSDLANEDFVLYRQTNGAGIHDLLMGACEAAGFQPRATSTTERVMSAINMVAAGFGVALVPQAIRAFNIPTVIYRELDEGDGFTVPLNVAFHRHTHSEAKRRFLAGCEAAAEAGAAH